MQQSVGQFTRVWLIKLRTNRLYTTAVFLVIGLLGSLAVDARMPVAPPISFDGSVIRVRAFEQSDHVFLPARSFFRRFGTAVFSPMEGTIVAFRAGHEVARFTVGSRNAIINGRPRVLPAPPFVVRNQTMVPLRIIGEAAGASVAYIAYPRSVQVLYHPAMLRRFLFARRSPVYATHLPSRSRAAVVGPWWAWLLLALLLFGLLIAFLRGRRRPLIVTTSRTRPLDPTIVTHE